MFHPHQPPPDPLLALLFCVGVGLAALLLLELIEFILRRLLQWLHRPATMGWVSQLFRRGEVMITGVAAGGAGSFRVTWNGGMQAGQTTSWSCDTADIQLSPSGDVVTVSVPLGETAAQFVLTAAGTNSAGQPVSATGSGDVLPSWLRTTKQPVSESLTHVGKTGSPYVES